jgi:hypothetical protein
MQADATDDEGRTDIPGGVTRAGKVRYLRLGDLDQRSSAYRETCATIAEIESDMGGREAMSTGERKLAERAAVLSSMLQDQSVRWTRGEPIDVAQFCTLANCERRLYETLGLQRRARNITPDLQSYLADKAAPPSTEKS